MFTVGSENAFWNILLILVGALTSLGLGYYRSSFAKIEKRKIINISIFLPIFVMAFSHLAYAFVDIENYLFNNSFQHLFYFWQGGYMVYGGLFGAIICIALIGGKKAASALEAYAPSMALMTIFFRLAEGVIGQGYGEYSETKLMGFPFMVYDTQNEIWTWAIFILESLIALIIFIILLKKKHSFEGDGMLLFMGLYASWQVLLESLRRDEFLRWGFVRVEELISVIVLLIVLIIYAKLGGKIIKNMICFAIYVLCLVLCILLEFATEGRIYFLEFLSTNDCYIVMAIACLIFTLCVLYLRKQSIHRYRIAA